MEILVGLPVDQSINFDLNNNDGYESGYDSDSILSVAFPVSPLSPTSPTLLPLPASPASTISSMSSISSLSSIDLDQLEHYLNSVDSFEWDTSDDTSDDATSIA